MDVNTLWEELKFELQSEKILKLGSKKEKKLLTGGGTRSGKLLFIGDDPDLYEDEDLRVVAGSSGEFFLKLCDLADIPPSEYYVTTLTKCNLRWKDLEQKEKDKLVDYLNMQVAIMKPRYIICLGEEIGRVVLGEDKKEELIPWKGGIEVYISSDPGHVKRDRDKSGKKAKLAIGFWNDLKYIKTLLEKEEK